MWGHHPAFGAPFLREGVRLFLPAERPRSIPRNLPPAASSNPGRSLPGRLCNQPDGPVDLSMVPSADAGFSELIYLKDLTAAGMR